MIKERAKEIDKTINKLSRYEGTMFEDQMVFRRHPSSEEQTGISKIPA